MSLGDAGFFPNSLGVVVSSDYGKPQTKYQALALILMYGKGKSSSSMDPRGLGAAPPLTVMNSDHQDDMKHHVFVYQPFPLPFCANFIATYQPTGNVTPKLVGIVGNCLSKLPEQQFGLV